MWARLALLALLAALFASCDRGNVRGDGPPSGSTRIPDLPGDAIPRPERRSKYGNGPEYEVFGKKYKVMNNSAGYRERGVASWYGKKFHGNLTSNRETYDMYQMTAAHKTLPLPTYVRVRNLRNNKTVVVRVNDRGPFIHNRIIDLSYAAALKLDIVRDGTGIVEITSISFDAPQGDAPSSVRTPPAPPQPESPQVRPPSDRLFVQVGAFGDRANAERRLAVLSSAGIDDAFIQADADADPAILRVRIGPVAGIIQYDILVEELENIGILDPYLIVE